MSNSSTIRLGTRGSALARTQANWVASQLRDAGHDVDLIEISTQGDEKTSVSVASLGSVGVFTKEIQRALLDDTIDLAVHSLKDLPTDFIENLTLASVPPREDCGDALISAGDVSFEDLTEGARIGTSSLRRCSQLLHQRPDLTLCDIRGNVDTRLRKLIDGEYDAIVLAEAGLNRLGLSEHITEVLPKDWMLPAVGQGALGLETRTDDETTRAAVATLDDAATHSSVLAERAMLLALAGGCLAPIGAWGRTDSDTLLLDAVVLSRDGKQRIAAADKAELPAAGEQAASAEFAKELGRTVAKQLLDQGAADLIAAARAE